MSTIHPESPLGRARAARAEAEAEVDMVQTIVRDLEARRASVQHTLDEATIETAPLEIAAAEAQLRQIDRALAEFQPPLRRATGAAQSAGAHAARLEREYSEAEALLVQLADMTNPYTENMTIRDHRLRMAGIRAQIDHVTGPPVPTTATADEALAGLQAAHPGMGEAIREAIVAQPGFQHVTAR